MREPRLVLNGEFRIIGVQPLGYSIALLVNLHFYGTFTAIHWPLKRPVSNRYANIRFVIRYCSGWRNLNIWEQL